MQRVSVLLPERLEGADGLLLRRWLVHDADALDDAVAQSLDHLRPWMGWIGQEPTLIEDRRVGRVIGSCGLHRRIGPCGLEIGYWIHPSFTRRGYATRAARLLTDAALAQPDISHVEIHHDKANLASAGIPRKLGFQFLGERRDEPEAPADLGIECRWRMDRQRWQAHCARAQADRREHEAPRHCSDRRAGKAADRPGRIRRQLANVLRE